MAKFVCKVCGYVYEGDAAPAECPVCHVGADMFEEVKGEMKLAAEHEYGIYAKTVKNNPDISDEDKKYIFDQLKANLKVNVQKLVCIYVWQELLIEKVILKLVYIGKKLLMKKQNMLLNLLKC